MTSFSACKPLSLSSSAYLSDIPICITSSGFLYIARIRRSVSVVYSYNPNILHKVLFSIKYSEMASFHFAVSNDDDHVYDFC